MQKRRRTAVKKEEENNSLPIYCVCRSTDGSRFMIACDRCEEWYHGDCINVTPKQAEQIKTFYCPDCRRDDTSLAIEYKCTRNQKSKSSRRPVSPGSSSSAYADQPSPVKSSKAKRSSANTSLSSNPDNSTNKLPSERSSPRFNSDRKYAPNDLKVSPTSLIDGFGDCSSTTSPPSGYFQGGYWPRDSDRLKYEDDPVPNMSQPPPRSRVVSPRLRGCGSCSGCTRTEDCGKCDCCRKFSGSSRMRQKCRLRQCTGAPISPRSRNPSKSSQNIGSRRRKQQTLQGVLLGSSSPNRVQQYTDFDDEPFEVPMDFSPRPYVESAAIYGQHPGNHTVAVGSKMRRGDHRLPTSARELDAMTSRPYQRLGIDGAIGTPNNSRNKEAPPSMFPLSSADTMDYLEEDSDEDVVLTGLPHCAGPMCMAPPVPGGKYCSETCRLKHANSRSNARSTPPRQGSSPPETIIPYNLPYPDHMYCRHHRIYNWHANGSVAPMNTQPYRPAGQSFDSQFAMEQAYIPDDLRQQRNHPAFQYSSASIHHIPQRLAVHNSASHAAVLNSTNRMGVLEGQGRPVICDNNDTTAFIDSMASVIRRSVIPMVDDLDIDLAPQHSSAAVGRLSPSSGMSNVNSCFAARSNGEAVRSIDLHHVVDPVDGLPPDVDEDGVDGEHVVPQTGGHPGYGYYITYSNDATNGRTSRASLDGTAGLGERRVDSNSLRSRSVNHRLLMPDGVDETNGIGSPYAAGRPIAIASTNMRHSALTGSSSSAGPDSRLGSSVSGVVGDVSSDMQSGVSTTGVTSHAINNYMPGPDEYYTINDSDDLEINWPQETVAGVNG
ncbi:unnamed protein product [Calicophoron daubneyi]|uniref:CXXC-type zinc finger protein 1 n=1 Tax=Calicophoron daubneyi TaxID=300641 RepID=A0AAV2TE96_CALDB